MQHNCKADYRLISNRTNEFFVTDEEAYNKLLSELMSAQDNIEEMVYDNKGQNDDGTYHYFGAYGLLTYHTSGNNNLMPFYKRLQPILKGKFILTTIITNGLSELDASVTVVTPTEIRQQSLAELF